MFFKPGMPPVEPIIPFAMVTTQEPQATTEEEDDDFLEETIYIFGVFAAFLLISGIGVVIVVLLKRRKDKRQKEAARRKAEQMKRRRSSVATIISARTVQLPKDYISVEKAYTRRASAVRFDISSAPKSSASSTPKTEHSGFSNPAFSEKSNSVHFSPNASTPSTADSNDARPPEYVNLEERARTEEVTKI